MSFKITKPAPKTTLVNPNDLEDRQALLFPTGSVLYRISGREFLYLNHGLDICTLTDVGSFPLGALLPAGSIIDVSFTTK